MIDIDHQQGQGLAAVHGFGSPDADFLVEQLAVGDPGQGVRHGFVAQGFDVFLETLNLAGGILQPVFQYLVPVFHRAGGGDDFLQHAAQVLQAGFGC